MDTNQSRTESSGMIPKELAKEMMDATRDGAVLRIIGKDLNARDTAFTLGVSSTPHSPWDYIPNSTNILAYLPFPWDFSPIIFGRFYLDSMKRIDGGWSFAGRDARDSSYGPLTIEVRAVTDPKLARKILQFRENLTPAQQAQIQSTMDHLLNPLEL